MTVGELIELLEQQPRDKEVLIDCRGTDYVKFTCKRVGILTENLLFILMFKEK